MTDQQLTQPVRILADHTVRKQLGHWTTDRRFEVHVYRGYALLDLRSPQIPEGDVELAVDLDHGLLKLLVPDDAVIDGWHLHRVGRGRVKDAVGPHAPGGRRIRVTGSLRSGEIRVLRGGPAVLTAMFSKQYLADLRRVHRDGGYPTVDDPTRTE